MACRSYIAVIVTLNSVFGVLYSFLNKNPWEAEVSYIWNWCDNNWSGYQDLIGTGRRAGCI